MSALAGSQRLQHSRHVRLAGSSPGFGTVRTVVLGLARLLFLPIASAAPLGIWTDKSTKVFGHSHADDAKDADDPNLWIYLAIAVVLVLGGGAFAGLTIAYMGQDETYLHVLAESGEESERKHATKVQELLKYGKHWVLVTLLLSNVITNETLPIVLDRSLGGGWPAVVSSTVLIVIFGEVVPQSICVRYGLSIGAYMTPIVLGLMWLMSPVAYPTAKLLDYLLGEEHGTIYKKAGLKTLVHYHQKMGTGDHQLMQDEVTIISSVLDLKDKPVVEIMTPMQDVFTMSADTVLDEKMMEIILSQGYSRIPIHMPGKETDFCGMLLIKILITYDPEDALRVRDFPLATLPETKPDTSCLDIINYFQEGKSHMVIVSDQPGSDAGALGVVTLEDVIEELIGEEIIDESDVFVDVHKAIRRIAPAPKMHLGKNQRRDRSKSADPGREDVGEETPLLGPGKGDNKRKNVQTTFLMRRRSSAASDSTHTTVKPVAVRGNTVDMKQHLKHLGPSNAASRPKTTKYSAVKIKTAGAIGTIKEDKPLQQDTDDSLERSRSLEVHPTEPEALQQAGVSADGEGASDGTAALMGQPSYGTINTPTDGNNMTAQEASAQARENTADTSADTSGPYNSGRNPTFNLSTASLNDNKLARDIPDTFTQQPERLVGSTGDLSLMVGTPNISMAPRRKARSGSITETMLEVGGVQKYVLETNSSSSEEQEDSRSPTIVAVDGTNDGIDEAGDSAQNGANGQADAKKKRRKRGKRKKGNDTTED